MTKPHSAPVTPTTGSAAFVVGRRGSNGAQLFQPANTWHRVYLTLSVPQMFRLQPLNQLVQKLLGGDGLDVIMDRAELIAQPLRGA